MEPTVPRINTRGTRTKRLLGAPLRLPYRGGLIRVQRVGETLRCGFRVQSSGVREEPRGWFLRLKGRVVT